MTTIQTILKARPNKNNIRNHVPLNPPVSGLADDIAGAYLFLASDLSAYITGAVIDVNGGMLIHG